MKFLEENFNHIDWENLSFNPFAVKLLEENLNKINWSNLSSNPSAIKILEQNQDKVDWFNLSYNTSIFEQDIPRYNQELDDFINKIIK